MGMSAFIGLLVRLVIFSNSACEIDEKFIIPQGMIEMDCEFAKTIGFVSSRFLSCSYLWGEGNRLPTVLAAIPSAQRFRMVQSFYELFIKIIIKSSLIKGL